MGVGSGVVGEGSTGNGTVGLLPGEINLGYCQGPELISPLEAPSEVFVEVIEGT